MGRGCPLDQEDLKENSLFFLRWVFITSAANERFPLWPIGSLPGQKSIRLAKKGRGSSLPKAGLRRYQPGDSFPPASLCGEKGGWK